MKTLKELIKEIELMEEIEQGYQDPEIDQEIYITGDEPTEQELLALETE